MLTIKDIENFKETFNDETPLGEPQHWIYLKSGRNLEITHEEDGLPENEQYFSIRLHCSEEEWEKGKIWGDEMHDTYNFGFIAGLKEAQRKLEVSEFLSNPEFKD